METAFPRVPLEMTLVVHDWTGHSSIRLLGPPVLLWCMYRLVSDDQHLTNDKGDGLPVLKTLSGLVSADRLVFILQILYSSLLEMMLMMSY